MTSEDSWPDGPGGDDAGNVSVRVGRRGAVRWSVELGHRLAVAISTTGDGRWVAGSAPFLAVGDRSGVHWSHDQESGPPQLLSFAGRSRVAVSQFRRGLAVLDLTDGREVARVEGEVVWPRALPEGGFAAIRIAGGVTIVRYDADAREQWSHPVPSVTGQLLVWHGTLLVVTKAELIGLHLDTGAVQWRAPAAGFGGTRVAFVTNTLPLDRDRLMIGVDAYERSGWAVVTPAAEQVTPWLPDGPRVLSQGPAALRRENGVPVGLISSFQATVLDTSLDGSRQTATPLWTIPIGLAADPSGAVAVAYSHGADYHDRYMWHEGGRDLQGKCGVTLISPPGTRRWTWDAPGPLAGFAVSAAGEVLVTSEGRLWAIG